MRRRSNPGERRAKRAAPRPPLGSSARGAYASPLALLAATLVPLLWAGGGGGLLLPPHAPPALPCFVESFSPPPRRAAGSVGIGQCRVRAVVRAGSGGGPARLRLRLGAADPADVGGSGSGSDGELNSGGRKRRGGEPAGVESLFSECRPRLAALGRVRRLVRRRRGGEDSHAHRGRHRPRHSGAVWLSALTTGGGSRNAPPVPPAVVDVWRVEEVAESIRSGGHGWALADDAELRRLAAMRLLLEDDFDRLRSEHGAGGSGSSSGGGLGPIGHDGSIPIDAFPDVYGDLRLLRFLRKDERQDPVSAAARYRDFMSWRADNGVDSVRADVEVNPFRPPPHLESVGKLIPCEFDFDGSVRCAEDTVPALLRVGSWNTAALTEKIRSGDGGDDDGITLEDFLAYWTHTYESIHRHLYLESVRRRRVVYVDEVCDLTGMSLRQFGPSFVSGVLKPWLKMTQLNYPETTKNLYFFRPPRIMNVAWNIVTPLASPGTVAKVRFCRGYEGTCDDFISRGDMVSGPTASRKR